MTGWVTRAEAGSGAVSAGHVPLLPFLTILLSGGSQQPSPQEFRKIVRNPTIFSAFSM
jgi:hypothetical protein